MTPLGEFNILHNPRTMYEAFKCYTNYVCVCVCVCLFVWAYVLVLKLMAITKGTKKSLLLQKKSAAGLFSLYGTILAPGRRSPPPSYTILYY